MFSLGFVAAATRRAISAKLGFALLKDLRIPLAGIPPSMRRGLIEGYYESNEAKAAQELFLPGDTVLELGAGIGFLSAYLRKHTQVGRIVAVEAHPEAIEFINLIHALDGIEVEVRHGAVVAKPNGFSTLYAHRELDWLITTTRQIARRRVRPTQAPKFAGKVCREKATSSVACGSASMFQSVPYVLGTFHRIPEKQCQLGLLSDCHLETRVVRRMAGRLLTGRRRSSPEPLWIWGSPKRSPGERGDTPGLRVPFWGNL